MNTIKGRIKEVIRPNGIGAITAAEHQALLLEVVDDVNKKKQDVIEDLDAIREGAQKGATAAQDIKTINEELGKKVNSSDLATINGLRIDEGGDIEIEGGMSEDEKAELNEKLTELSEGKADKNGKYADLTAGDLYGHGESVPAEFSFRASGGKSIKDGTAYIKEVHGNAVVWNQKAGNNLSSNNFELDYRGGLIIGSNIKESASQGLGLTTQNKKSIVGHKYVWIFSCTDTRCTCSIGNKYNILSGMITEATDAANCNIYPYGATKEIIPINTQFELSAQLIDLTKMFGAGNEPTTIEEYNARKPIVEDEYAYNEGEVIPFTAEGIKSVGDNAWDEQWELGRLNTDTGQPNPGNNGIQSKNYNKVLPNEAYYCGYNAAPIFAMFYDAEYNLIRQVSGSNNFINIRNRQFTTPANAVYMKFYVVDITTYNHDIMITLVHSGWKVDTNAGYQPYWADTLLIDERIKAEFPNGMHKWDKVYNKDGKGYIVKGTGSVDMGDCAWSYDSANQVFTTYTIMDLMAHPSVTEDRNKGLMCAKYAPSKGLVASTMDNKSWLRIPKNITIKDTDYTDAASLKAAMQGVMLYYELAEPTIIEYDKPFQLDYKVADFGTEEIIGTLPSAPFKGRTIYQFNAVDQIRENYNEIEKIKAALAKAGITLDL